MAALTWLQIPGDGAAAGSSAGKGIFDRNTLFILNHALAVKRKAPVETGAGYQN